MHDQKKPQNIAAEESILTPTYAAREMTGTIPKHRIPEQSTAPQSIYNVIHDEGYIRFIKSKKQPVISEPCVSEMLKIIERSQVVPSFNTRSEYVKYVCQILSVKSIY